MTWFTVHCEYEVGRVGDYSTPFGTYTNEKHALEIAKRLKDGNKDIVRVIVRKNTNTVIRVFRRIVKR